MLDKTTTTFSGSGRRRCHQSAVIAHLVKANMAPEKGTGWHRHEADSKSIDVPAPTPWV